MPSLKKITIILIIAIESIAGAVFLIKYQQKQLLQKKILSINNIAVIDKKNTVYSLNKNLEYYWEFLPNTAQEDHPDWLPDKVIYNINNDGLNDRFDYSIQKPENTYRIITLGDSFTYGHYIDTQNNWTEKLEELLNNSLSTCKYDRFEVINLGMPGFDVQYISKRYADIGAKYNPDLILWFESGSGFTRFNELMSPLIQSCEEDALNNDEYKQKQTTYYCWHQAEEEMIKKNSMEYLDEILNKSFESFFEVAEHSKTVFFYYDDTWSRKKEVIEKMRSKYKNASFITSVPQTSVLARFIDGHPNIRGHESLSKYFFNYLEKKLNCSN